MNHLESVKRWPAMYAMMAAVLDDVAMDEEKAQEKWGRLVVAASKEYSSAAVSEGVIMYFFDSLLNHLGVDAEVKERNKTTQADTSTGIGKTSAAVPASNPGGVVSAPARRPKRSGTNRRLEGIITEVRVDQVSFQGKPPTDRHVMVVKERGRQYGIEGTIPREFVGKVKAGDEVALSAEVVDFDNRQGWYKWPKGMKVVARA